MADTLDEFRRKNAAQFVRAKYGLQALARQYVYELANELIHRTPGFGGAGYAGPEGKLPYTPTGRLRGGWNWTLTPVLDSGGRGRGAARGEDGPFSDYGVETLARILSQIASQKMGGISYLENDVGYAVDVAFSLRNHAHIPHRNFPDDTRRMQFTIYERALAGLKESP